MSAIEMTSLHSITRLKDSLVKLESSDVGRNLSETEKEKIAELVKELNELTESRNIAAHDLAKFLSPILKGLHSLFIH